MLKLYNFNNCLKYIKKTHPTFTTCNSTMFKDELHQNIVINHKKYTCNSTMFKDELHQKKWRKTLDYLVTPQCLKMNYISMFVIP